MRDPNTEETKQGIERHMTEWQVTKAQMRAAYRVNKFLGNTESLEFLEKKIAECDKALDFLEQELQQLPTTTSLPAPNRHKEPAHA